MKRSKLRKEKTQDVGDARAMRFRQKELQTGCGTNVLQSTKVEGVGDLKGTLTSDMKIRNVEFTQLTFSLALVRCFRPTLPFPLLEW